MRRDPGWIFGFYAKTKIPEHKSAEIEKLLPQHSIKSINPNFCIYFNQSKNTFYNINSQWLINGIGVCDSGSKYKLMDQSDWENFFISPGSIELSGHFIKISWDYSAIRISNDRIGLKTIYYLEAKDEIYFSTNLGILLRFLHNPEIDLSVFGSKWLLFNPLNYNSFIKGIKKLQPNSELYIGENGLKITTKEYGFLTDSYPVEKFFDELNKLINIQIPENYQISFGLSGGLDSRLLLALFYKSKREINLHSFGFEYENDVKIASALAYKLNIEHKVLKSDLNDQVIIDLMPEYISQNELIEPASTFLRLYKLNDVYFENKIILDGANGEIYRRQFLNRLYYAGIKPVMDKNVGRIFSALRFNRADIFKDDVYNILADGAKEDILECLDKMPDVKSVGLENYLDLLNIRTRFANYFGPEQMRLDSFIISVMPYINDNLLKNVFGLSLKEKNNSRLYIGYLRKIGAPFSSIPLVKGDTTYPFGLSKIQSAVYTRLKGRLLSNHQKSPVVEFYNHTENHVKELLLDNSTLACSYYDSGKIQKIVQDFYSGDKNNAVKLDWLFSFELFRRNLLLN